MPPIARWTLLSRSASLARSSHCLSITPNGRALLYGGELKPRTPVDAEAGATGSVHIFDVPDSLSTKQLGSWRTSSAVTPASAPTPRVGAASIVIGDSLYVWGGRGGVDMAPIAGTQAGVWRLALTSTDKGNAQWERLEAVNEEESPQPRSYHTIANVNDELYIHAGCPTTGRISELHSFDISSRTWKVLAPGPDPGRGGTVLATTKLDHKDVLLRFAGFAGHQLGEDHAVDIYDIASNTWRTVTPIPDPSHGHPGPRSVHGFVGFSSPAHPTAVALLYHGEREASVLGHAGAGKFWNDVWLLHGNPGEEGTLKWERVAVLGDAPEARGWFPSASWVDDSATSRVVLFGGLLSSNERSDELWALEIS